ncbi:MAG: hypothetical protein R2747_21360 [Pyrinomonadaceae bacterium]
MAFKQRRKQSLPLTTVIKMVKVNSGVISEKVGLSGLGGKINSYVAVIHRKVELLNAKKP